MEEKKKNHQLFIGPFQPELEEGLLAFLKRKKETDPLSPLVVLIGSNLLGLYLRRFLVLRGLNHINLRFLTFIDFAKALAAGPMNREGFRPLPRFGDLVVVSFLTEKIERGSYFSPIASRRGFQRALGATFRDLWDGGMEELPPKEDRKWVELNTLYQSYRSLIGEGFYNDSELLFRAGKESHRFPEIFNCGELVIYGFYDFTQGQKQLLQACANSLSFTAFMPWRETLGFVYASPTLKWYSQLGFQAKSLEDSKERGVILSRFFKKKSFGESRGRRKGPLRKKTERSPSLPLPAKLKKCARSPGRFCVWPMRRTFPSMKWPFSFATSTYTPLSFRKRSSAFIFRSIFKGVYLSLVPRSGKAYFFSSTWLVAIFGEMKYWSF